MSGASLHTIEIREDLQEKEKKRKRGSCGNHVTEARLFSLSFPPSLSSRSFCFFSAFLTCVTPGDGDCTSTRRLARVPSPCCRFSSGSLPGLPPPRGQGALAFGGRKCVQQARNTCYCVFRQPTAVIAAPPILPARRSRLSLTLP